MSGAGSGYRRPMPTPIYVRSLSQVLGMLSAGVTQVALAAVGATRKQRG